jgi:hypothetical protein
MPEPLDPMEMILAEVRELRADFKILSAAFYESQINAAHESGERKGRTSVLSASVSFIVAAGVALAQAWLFHK